MKRFFSLFFVLLSLSLLLPQKGGTDGGISAGRMTEVGGIVILPLKSSRKGSRMETDFADALNGEILSISSDGSSLLWRTERKGILLPGEYALTKSRRVQGGNLVSGEICVWSAYKSRSLGGEGNIEMLILDDGKSDQSELFILNQHINSLIASVKKWVDEKESLTSDEDVRFAALSLLTTAGAGSTHRSGPFKKVCERLLQMLLNRVKDEEGVFSEDGYTNALGTMALCELYAVTQEPNLTEVVKTSVKELIRRRAKDGCWGKGATAEKSTPRETFFGVLALRSAQSAGIRVESNLWRKASECIKTWCEQGAFSNTEDEMTVTAGAPFSLIFCGLSRREKAVKEKCSKIAENYSKIAERPLLLYFATCSLFQYGGEVWKEWAEKMLQNRLLPKRIREEGDLLRLLSYEMISRYKGVCLRRGRRVIPSGLRWLSEEDRKVIGEYCGILTPSLRLAILTSDIPQEALSERLSELCKKIGAKVESYTALKKRLEKRIEAAVRKISRAFTRNCCGYLLVLPDGRALLEVFDGRDLFKRYRDRLVEALAVESALHERPADTSRRELLKVLKKALETRPPEREDFYTKERVDGFTGRYALKNGIGIKFNRDYIYRLIPVSPGR